MGPVKLLERAAGTAVHTIRHPVASVAYAAGMARGFAGMARHVVAGATGHGAGSGPTAVPTQRESTSGGASATATATPTAPPKPQRVPKPVPDPSDLPEPIVIEAEDEPGESFATEPKATSRGSAHGERGDDADVDQWTAQTPDEPDVDVETPVGTTGADAGFNPDTAEADLQQPGTEPLLDPATAKAIRSESAMLRKDAERDPD